MKRLVWLVPLITLCIGCSTVRLTPGAAERLKKNEKVSDVIKDLDEATAGLGQARDNMLDLANQYLERVLSSDNVDALNEVGPLDVSEGLQRALMDGGALEAAVRFRYMDQSSDAADKFLEKLAQENGGVGSLQRNARYLGGVAASEKMRAYESQLDKYSKEIRQLEGVDSGDYSYFVDGTLYFSIEPVIAIGPNIRTTPIPSLGVNWRPFPAGKTYSAVALQLVVGGALNPSNSDQSVGGAIGAGLSYPIAGKGAISVGGIVWNRGDTVNDDGSTGGSDSTGALYISLTLGDFGQATN